MAFSGEITLKEFVDKKFTEVGMNNGIKESELPSIFNTEEYQVLLVAEKYQTGPVIIAGYGCLIKADAKDEVDQLSQLVNIPVTTSLKGKGVISEQSEPVSGKPRCDFL